MSTMVIAVGKQLPYTFKPIEEQAQNLLAKETSQLSAPSTIGNLPLDHYRNNRDYFEYINLKPPHTQNEGEKVDAVNYQKFLQLEKDFFNNNLLAYWSLQGPTDSLALGKLAKQMMDSSNSLPVPPLDLTLAPTKKLPKFDFSNEEWTLHENWVDKKSKAEETANDSLFSSPILSKPSFKPPAAKPTLKPHNLAYIKNATLFAPELGKIGLQQQGNNTCYLLAALDAILHHPKGSRILSKIKIKEYPDRYEVDFPAQPEPIPISKAEIANTSRAGVRSTSIDIRLIERAYLKISGVVAGDFDQTTRALERIFGWRLKESESISLQNDPGAQQFIGGIQFPFSERKAQFQEYLRTAIKEPNPTDVDIMTAIRNGGNHYHSIRLDKSTPSHVVIANPYNTTTLVHRIPIDQFLNHYHVEGIRIPI